MFQAASSYGSEDVSTQADEISTRLWQFGWWRNSSFAKLASLAIFAAIAVSIERIWLSVGLPLWLDETWTAVIASQPSWTLFWREAWLDCNAPLYYLIEKTWVSFFGVSNATLRLPSMIFLYAAAALPLVWRSHGLDRRATLVWATLLLLWWPGTMIALDARSYALLLMLSVAGVIAFTKAYRMADWQSLLVWSLVCALQVLTHYFALILVGVQGAALLWKWRTEMLRRWYCFLPFAVPAAWMLWHLPRLREYARPDVVWYEPTSLATLWYYISFTFGSQSAYFIIMIGLVLGGAAWKSGWRLKAQSPDAAETSALLPIQTAAIAGVVALIGILLATALQASLADRYLVPLVPSMLLGVILLVNRIPRTDLAYGLLILVYMVYALTPGPFQFELRKRAFYGFEEQSDFIARSNPTDLVFVWDHPAAKILAPHSLQQIGGFFLERQGIRVRTNALILSERDNPNKAIEAAVRNDRTGILWLYDGKRRSAAAHFPPVFARNPAWQCLDQRYYQERKLGVGVIACFPAKNATIPSQALAGSSASATAISRRR